MREYYEQLDVKEFDHLDKRSKCLEISKLPKLIQEETDNPNSTISIKEIEFGVKNLPTKKISSPKDLTGEFQQTFKEERVPILCKLLQNTENTWLLLTALSGCQNQKIKLHQYAS